MGALHSGHAALIKRACEITDEVVVSIFVNPTQFGPAEDYLEYPRPVEADLAAAEAAGAAWTFLPEVEEIYPNGLDGVSIHIGTVGDHWEGAARPGHFDGVATVVAKLLGLVSPSIAVFGRKDLQQCAVVRRLIDELRMPIGFEVCDTVREADGLAMSSRNVYLSPAERKEAPRLYECLKHVRSAILSGRHSNTASILKAAAGDLADTFAVEYLALVNSETMEAATAIGAQLSVIIAAKLGSTRLIDNLALR